MGEGNGTAWAGALSPAARYAETGGASLTWENLTAVLPGSGGRSTKKLLQGLYGYAVPGRIVAIMGPSGSGKSTLLDSLSGRLARNVLQTGKVLLNGKKRRLDFGAVAYVTQENVLLGTLTVRETVTYSAQLRLPSSMSKAEVRRVVDDTLDEMGLRECADRPIGTWHLRGISGGEKKRLCIALEILTRPRLLFLDEPTSGLDSASAFSVIETLRTLAIDGGRTIVSSVHQPSSEVFALFDDLCLLSSGESVYFGDAKLAPQFFAETGFPCPSRRNPSDHFLRCVNSDFDDVATAMKGSMKLRAEADLDPLLKYSTSEIRERLVDKYRISDYAMMVRNTIHEISKIEGVLEEAVKGSQATWCKQLRTLTKRSYINMYRDFGYYRLRIIIYVLMAICLGTIYYDVGNGYTAIQARASCGGFVSGFMTFMSIGGFPSFIEEMKVFSLERQNGHYGVAAYIISNFLSSMPFLLTMSWASASITYWMVKFRPGFSYFAFFALNLYGGVSVIESLMMIISALVPNFLMGLILGAGQNQPTGVVSLKGQSGNTWLAELASDNEGLFFVKGWKEFVRDHSIEMGHFLTFRYDGRSQFSVVIFDGMCIEKPSAFHAKPRKDLVVKLESGKGDMDINAADPSQVSVAPLEESNETTRKRVTEMDANGSTSKKRSSILENGMPEASAVASAVTCKVAPASLNMDMNAADPPEAVVVPLEESNQTTRKRVREIDADDSALQKSSIASDKDKKRCPAASVGTYKSASTSLDSTEDSDSSSSMLEQSISCIKSELASPIRLRMSKDVARRGKNSATSQRQLRVVSQRPLITEIQKDNALLRAKQFKSKNPFVHQIMKESYVYVGFFLNLPREFVRECLPRANRKLKLWDPQGKSWDVNYIYYSERCNGAFSGGWGKFSLGNNLEKFDVCVFELVSKDNIKVHIYRVVPEITPFLPGPGRK